MNQNQQTKNKNRNPDLKIALFSWVWLSYKKLTPPTYLIQILDEQICIPLCTIAPGKNMISSLPDRQTGIFSLDRQPVWEKEKLKFKPVILYIKIYIVLFPAHGRRVG